MDPLLAAQRLANRRQEAGEECRFVAAIARSAVRHQISWHWVKGHSGHPENDRVDELACAEADAQRQG
jgi:ribonuclease HI